MAIGPLGTGSLLPGCVWAGLVRPLEFVVPLEATLPGFGLAVLPALALATVRGDGNVFPLVLGVVALGVAVPLRDEGGCGSWGITGTGLVAGAGAA